MQGSQCGAKANLAMSGRWPQRRRAATDRTEARALHAVRPATGTVIGHLTGRVIWDSPNLLASPGVSDYGCRLLMGSGFGDIGDCAARLRDGVHAAFAQRTGRGSGRRSSSAQSAMALGVKAGVAAAVSYHSLTAAPIYQNLIVRTRTALPVTDRLAALESRWTALPNRARSVVGPLVACVSGGRLFQTDGPWF